MDMILDNTFLIFALGVFLILLIIVQLFLALRHDHVVRSQSRWATLDWLDTQIEARRQEFQDLDEDLKKRRQALGDVARIGADVDALTTKLDELNAEWNTLAERREEVRKMRRETEEAWGEKQRVDGDLREAREQFDGVKKRLEKAEDIAGKIESLERRENELRVLLASLEGEARELQDAKERIKNLQDREQILVREIASLEGRRNAAECELQDLSTRMSEDRTTLAQIGGEVTDLRAQRASAQETITALGTKKEELEQHVQRLQQDRTDLEYDSGRLGKVREEVDKAIQARSMAQSQLDDVETRLSKQREELSGIEGRIAAAQEMLIEKRRKLQAKEDVSVHERLKELNTRPAVLLNLESLPRWVPRAGDRRSEAEALERVSDRFEAVGLRYHPRTLRAFHTSLKVNETTQITVLSGISGTGKSQLPRQYAAGMGIGFLQVPVQPRWDSPQDLMGFYNYIEGRFRPTDLARALWQLDPLNNESAIKDLMMLVLLDEMNLARVEYYFSDFLSRLESRPPPDGVNDGNLRKDAEIELEIPMPRGIPAKRVFPGFNLLFAGTMNEDESTQALSDKVVDRANVMRFGAPQRIESTKAGEHPPNSAALSRGQWNNWVQPISLVEDEIQVKEGLEKMRELMAGFNKPFGHRLVRAMLAYVANYPELSGVDRNREALADQVEMRLLPKLRGVELDRADVDRQFEKLRSFVEDDLGDSALGEAIADSVKTVQDGSGQFVWIGVNRT